MGWANEGRPSPACPPQLPQAINPLDAMYFWLSVFALSTLLVMCKSSLYAPYTSPTCFNAPAESFWGPTVTFRYRAALINPMRSLFPRLGHYQPLSTFAEQADAGLSSSTFDIEANIRDGDSRAGLDERGTQEVLDIMRRERVK